MTFGLGIWPAASNYLISITILSICISNRSSVASGHQGPASMSAADRDASRRAVVHARAIAVIATELAAVVHVEFAAAMATA